MRGVAAALASGLGLFAAAHPAAAAPTTPNASAYSTIQCEDYDDQNGIHLEAHPNGVHAGFISTGDWLRYDKIDFTSTPVRRMLIRASDAARENRTGIVQVRLDKITNAPIGSLTIPNNGDWLSFVTYEVSLQATTGLHTVFLTFTSSQNEEFANADWITFKS